MVETGIYLILCLTLSQLELLLYLQKYRMKNSFKKCGNSVGERPTRLLLGEGLSPLIFRPIFAIGSNYWKPYDSGWGFNVSFIDSIFWFCFNAGIPLKKPLEVYELPKMENCSHSLK